MLKKIKDRLYFLKVWWKKTVAYPARKLSVAEASNYDAYWRNKRGSNLGALSLWQQERTDIVYGIIKETPGLTIGDIGSGPGSVVNHLVSRLPGARGVGYDLSPVALEIVKDFGLEPVALDIRNPADLEKLRPADYNLLFEIIEHVPHSEALVRAAMASARKGIFISIPNTGFFTYRIRLMFLGKTPLQWTITPDEHLRFWTRTDLCWWLKALGYPQAQVWGYRGVPILNKLWPNLFAAGLVAYVPKS